MEVDIDIQDIQEIEEKMEDLAGWLTHHFSSFPACCIVLQAVQDKVKELKKMMDFDGEIND